MKTTYLSLLVIALFVSTLVGCGGNTAAPVTTQPSDFDRLVKMIEENEKKAAALAADDRKKFADAIAELKKPVPADGSLDTRTVSQKVDSFHLAHVPGCGDPCCKTTDEANGLVIVRGRKTAAEVFRAREVQAHICVVPQSFIPQPAPVFVQPEPAMQQMLPIVPPIAPVQPVPGGQPMQQPMPAPQGGQPAPQVPQIGPGVHVMQIGPNGQLLPVR